MDDLEAQAFLRNPLVKKLDRSAVDLIKIIKHEVLGMAEANLKHLWVCHIDQSLGESPSCCSLETFKKLPTTNDNY